MAIDMSTVKAITHNNKDVVKIEDSNGNVLWKKGPDLLYYQSYQNNTLHAYKIDNYVWSSTSGVNANAQYIWTDGVDLYISQNSNHYRYENGAWTVYTGFTGIDITSFNGNMIWTDGDHIYYSNGGTQYQLNVATKEWTAKTWNGLSSFSGNNIWSDGTNIYCNTTSRTNIYVLDKTTSTWTSQSMTTSATIQGWAIWSVNNHIYYSNGGTQLEWNSSTYSWSSKTWNGLTNFTGSRIFKYDGNIYTIPGNTTDIYKLNTSTDTWSLANSDFDLTALGTLSYIWFRGDQFWTPEKGLNTVCLHNVPQVGNTYN